MPYSVFGRNRNERSEETGISVRQVPESVFDLGRNTQPRPHRVYGERLGDEREIQKVGERRYRRKDNPLNTFPWQPSAYSGRNEQRFRLESEH